MFPATVYRLKGIRLRLHLAERLDPGKGARPELPNLPSVQLSRLDFVKGGSQFVAGRELEFKTQFLSLLPWDRLEGQGSRSIGSLRRRNRQCRRRSQQEAKQGCE